MSKKCFGTIILYSFFLTFMIGTAVVFSYLNFNNVIAKVVVIVVLIFVSTALALITERGSLITILFSAMLWGSSLSFLFDYLGLPNLLQIVYVALVMLFWFALFCLLTRFSFIKQNYATSMIFWSIVLVVADIVFVVNTKNVLGWTSLILLVPFFTFFTALPGEAEDFTEHTHHIAIYSVLPSLLIVMLFLFFRVPIGSYEKPDFFPEVDDDYIFTYCPKQTDNNEKYPKENISDIM